MCLVWILLWLCHYVVQITSLVWHSNLCTYRLSLLLFSTSSYFYMCQKCVVLVPFVCYKCWYPKCHKTPLNAALCKHLTHWSHHIKLAKKLSWWLFSTNPKLNTTHYWMKSLFSILTVFGVIQTVRSVIIKWYTICSPNSSIIVIDLYLLLKMLWCQPFALCWLPQICYCCESHAKS